MKIGGIVLIVLPLALLLWHYGTEFLSVDACLDAGKVYDYQQHLCRDDVQHLPYVPYTERYGWLIALVSASVVMGLGMVIVAVKRQGVRQQ